MTEKEVIEIIDQAAREGWIDIVLRGRGIESLPAEIGELTNLRVLNLYDNQLISLQALIGKLKNLQELNLPQNQLKSLPAEIGKLTNLSMLNVGYNRLVFLPIDIGKLTNLRMLRVYNNQLTSLPAEIGKLKNLRELDVSGNQLKELPVEIGRLTNLRELNINENQLEELPAEIGKLTNLQRLNIRGNQLTKLPAEIGKLTNLRELIVNGNQLKKLPAEICKMTNTQTLSLSNNKLMEVPDEIYKLTNLKKLYLFDNQLTRLPAEIGKMKSLKELYLFGNQLKQLPAEIDHLENLERLSLDENQLSNISVLMRLKNLKMLGLSRNQITELPREVLDLGIAIWSKRGFSAYGKERDGIYLKANPLERPPMEIVKQGREAIRNYFESVEVESSKVYEAKLLVVGEGGVGKTCLMKRLMEPEKAIDEKELTTEGIGINRWFVDTKRAKNFRVNFWDFGGQEIYHATHQFFLTKRSLYLFVWTARTDDDMTSFDYWLNVVRLLSDNSPVIVVLNKTDERIKSIDEHSLQEKFGNIVWFDRVSAQEGTGIKGLINTIKERIAELPHIGDELPTVWVDIRKKLEGLDRHYISFEEYKGICWQFGLNEERAEHLSRYYHDLGVFLHFMDNAVLREIVFLKPDWATNAVYIVADTREVQEEHGRFEFGQLKKIWGDYPEDKYAHLLELMKKFELCFQIPRTQTYIVPELLRPSRPKFEWDYKDNLRFEYRYEFMPAGIITRFIVRTHDMVKDDIYWKNGVILQRENTEALVISERLNRKISIWIRGEKKKELLAIIRREIDYIHNTLNEPDVKEMIPCTCSGCAMAEEPHFYDYQTLCRFRRKGKIACEESTEDVSIENLLGDYEREKDKRKMEYRERGDTYIANQMSFGNKAQHVGRDIKTTTPEPKKKWQKSVIKLLIIFASIATILILLFGDDLYTRFKAKPKSDKPTVEQAMNESPGGVQIAGDVYVKKSESHIYRELSSNIKNEMTLLLKKLREQYNNVNVKISVTSEKGNQVRHRVAEEISAIIASARFDAKLAQPILRFSNDTSDVVIKYNENDTELVKDLSKVLNLLFKGTSFLAKKDTNLQRYELQIIIAGDPLFSSNGTVTFQ